MDGQMTIFDFIQDEDESKDVRIPCMRRCEVECWSLRCFLKRGYIRHDGKWVRNEKGEILIANQKECYWTPRER